MDNPYGDDNEQRHNIEDEDHAEERKLKEELSKATNFYVHDETNKIYEPLS